MALKLRLIFVVLTVQTLAACMSSDNECQCKVLAEEVSRLTAEKATCDQTITQKEEPTPPNLAPAKPEFVEVDLKADATKPDNMLSALPTETKAEKLARANPANQLAAQVSPTVKEENAPASPAIKPASESNIAAPLKEHYVNVSSLNIRRGPST